MWKENVRFGKETFYGDCIKNDKISPDKCIPLSNECDHKKKLVEEDCEQCENLVNGGLSEWLVRYQTYLTLLPTEELQITVAELTKILQDTHTQQQQFLVAATSELTSRETNT
jgi:hypothetical protein